MDETLTNLIPPERQRALSRDHLVRLGVVILVLITILIAVAGALLLPTYIFLAQSISAKQEHLANIESVLASANETSLSAQLAALSNDAVALAKLGSIPSASAILRTALSIPRNGVALSGFVYTPAGGKKSGGTLSLSGVAMTRDALRVYQLALQSAPFATAANLPVSAYAKDTDIAFTIVLTLAP